VRFAPGADARRVPGSRTGPSGCELELAACRHTGLGPWSLARLAESSDDGRSDLPYHDTDQPPPPGCGRFSQSVHTTRKVAWAQDVVGMPSLPRPAFWEAPAGLVWVCVQPDLAARCVPCRSRLRRVLSFRHDQMLTRHTVRLTQGCPQRALSSTCMGRAHLWEAIRSQHALPDMAIQVPTLLPQQGWEDRTRRPVAHSISTRQARKTLQPDAPRLSIGVSAHGCIACFPYFSPASLFRAQPGDGSLLAGQPPGERAIGAGVSRTCIQQKVSLREDVVVILLSIKARKRDCQCVCLQAEPVNGCSPA